MRDYARNSGELVRTLRDRRSRAQLGRKLGYASNLVPELKSTVLKLLILTVAGWLERHHEVQVAQPLASRSER